MLDKGMLTHILPTFAASSAASTARRRASVTQDDPMRLVSKPLAVTRKRGYTPGAQVFLACATITACAAIPSSAAACAATAQRATFDTCSRKAQRSICKHVPRQYYHPLIAGLRRPRIETVTTIIA